MIKHSLQRILRSALCLVVGISCLTGCGSSKTYDDIITNEGYDIHQDESDSDSTSYIGTAIPKEDLKVGVIHLTDPAEGSGYTYTHDLGIQGMQDNLGLSSDQIIRKINVDDSNEDETRQAIQDCIDEGCQIIFTTSWGYMNVTAEMAEENPDVFFAHGTGYMSNGKNFTNYFGRIYQARYLSGIAAGRKTKTNKIGYVAAQDINNSEVTGGIDAFALGVYSVNPDAKIYVRITNSWFDMDKEKQYAEDLVDAGCDVLAQHCDTSFPQQVATEHDVWGIGYNSDMSKDTPDATLCSVIWNWSAYYTQAVQSVIEGKWTGENYYGGMKEGLVDITGLSDTLNDEETISLINDARASILNGSFNVFDGEIETNTGDIIGKKNSTLDDATITGGINWYFKTVSVLNDDGELTDGSELLITDDTSEE
ncbi:MAG: BMP family ABC transporter substrate-binding protein [Lachnospiraceae bacterium]|nr:BMP family ABC transporter substrate-binding protein [Lachnospiraceae bacterium]